MKTVSDLNEILFNTIDKLSDESLDGEQLEAEIKRSEAIQKVAKNIIDNTGLTLKAAEYMVNSGSPRRLALPMFGNDE